MAHLKISSSIFENHRNTTTINSIIVKGLALEAAAYSGGSVGLHDGTVSLLATEDGGVIAEDEIYSVAEAAKVMLGVLRAIDSSDILGVLGVLEMFIILEVNVELDVVVVLHAYQPLKVAGVLGVGGTPNMLEVTNALELLDLGAALGVFNVLEPGLTRVSAGMDVVEARDSEALSGLDSLLRAELEMECDEGSQEVQPEMKPSRLQVQAVIAEQSFIRTPFGNILESRCISRSYAITIGRKNIKA
ncbi:uncharacterized protein BDR25DRAFT_316979 [Lindgomyces ingoldianus]|uniref:Uncharacterized protein n=1 Tax=Lindgomyces ingoldianus TaxID=673940 RepID=A0ACB6QJP0_9PLEO|nr:uncharacterized protein BDR25DRAFT_316979 [Lindgomyces ingoldianus]KAF2467218.1 hypothetical protein BDR25DRAFT_316979 [Lindgomyces ingoldianus]